MLSRIRHAKAEISQNMCYHHVTPWKSWKFHSRKPQGSNNMMTWVVSNTFISLSLFYSRFSFAILFAKLSLCGPFFSGIHVSEIYFRALFGKTCEKKPVFFALKYIQKRLVSSFFWRNVFAGVTTVVTRGLKLSSLFWGKKKMKGTIREKDLYDCCLGSGPGFAPNSLNDLPSEDQFYGGGSIWACRGVGGAFAKLSQIFCSHPGNLTTIWPYGSKYSLRR